MQGSGQLGCRTRPRSSPAGAGLSAAALGLLLGPLLMGPLLMGAPAQAAQLVEPIVDPSVGSHFSPDLWRSSLEAATRHTAAPEDRLSTHVGRHGGEWVVELRWWSQGPQGPVLKARHTALLTGSFNDLLHQVPDLVGTIAQLAEAEHFAVAPSPPSTSLERELQLPGRARTTANNVPPLTLHEQDGGNTLVLPLAAAGVAVAGVVVGAIFQALSAQGQAQVQYAPVTSGEARSALNLAVAANVAFGVAGLAAITGGVLLLVDYQSNDGADAHSGSAGSATLVVPF